MSRQGKRTFLFSAILVALFLLPLLFPTTAAAAELEAFSYCNQIADATERSKCQSCVILDENGQTNTLYTAFGCLRIDSQGLVSDLVQVLLGVGGGVALLTILFAAFILSVSRGDVKQVDTAKELITAATTGIFFMIFSAIILQFIGVDILRIPGLG